MCSNMCLKISVTETEQENKRRKKIIEKKGPSSEE